MKKFIITALLLMLSLGAFAQNGKSIYMQYSDADGVSAVYISSAMFRMMGKIPDIETTSGGVNLAPIISNLKGMYIINSENPGINGQLASDVIRMVTSGEYELLMEAKESGEKVTMYTCGDEKTVTSFIMLADEGSELTFICFDGLIDRAQLENLLSENIEIDN